MANITVIPASKTLHSKMPVNARSRRKVAGYARVSTDSEEQLTSYEAQVDYYTKYIRSNPDWEFVRVYTDEGISATNTRHRDGFNRMIADALAERYHAAQDRLDELQKLKITRSFQDDVLECFMFEIKAIDNSLPLEFTDRFWNNQIDRVMVYHDGRMVFRFKNGTEVEETL